MPEDFVNLNWRGDGQDFLIGDPSCFGIFLQIRKEEDQKLGRNAHYTGYSKGKEYRAYVDHEPELWGGIGPLTPGAVGKRMFK